MPRTFIMRLVAFLLVLFLVAGIISYAWPLPQPKLVKFDPVITASQAAELAWPTYGQAAIGASGYGVLATHGPQTEVPIASVTKVITVLAVLKKYPIAPGQPGDTITLSENDVRIYQDYLAKNGSVAKVEAGEKITEYQALQALLLPSANNIADSLAIWAFGSIDTYVNYANQMLKQMGLSKTHVADASGFSPQSVSTAAELVALGETALANNVIAEMVNQPETTLPVAGVVRNFNWLLGSDGVVGIKTGNTSEAGGCYLFAADRQIAGQKVKLIGAILGAPTRNAAINDSRPLIKSADAGFEMVNLLTSGTVVGSYNTAWGVTADAITNKDASLLAWKGQEPQVTLALNPSGVPAAADKIVGSVQISVGKKSVDTPVVLQQQISDPPWSWRIFR